MATVGDPGHNWQQVVTYGNLTSMRMRTQTATYEERQRKSGSTATPNVYTTAVVRWKYLRVTVLT